LLDHLQAGRVDFAQLQILVLDEADRMLDMGFAEAMEAIIQRTPHTRQTMLFSATLDGVVGRMARDILRDPLVVRVEEHRDDPSGIEQRVHFVDDASHKSRLLQHLLRDVSVDQALVFTATKRDADLLAGRLADAGFVAAALHGDMAQNARNRTLNAMRDGRVRVLVATDVAARGIDVPSISHVFNFDLPRSPEDYVHRIGRTGRAGRTGLAVSLAQHAELRTVRNIERFTRQDISVEIVAGHEPKRLTSARPMSRPGRKQNDARSFSRGDKRASSQRNAPTKSHGVSDNNVRRVRSGHSGGTRRQFDDR
jgi:superfamily II DNA/RNA helicase